MPRRLSAHSPASPTPNDKPIPLVPLSPTSSTRPRHLISSSEPPLSRMTSPHPQPSVSTTIPQSDALHAVKRQTTHLQSTLQTLLDAQSEGLLAGLTGTSNGNDGSSTGSRTPTSSTPHMHHDQRKTRSKNVIPVRQPAQKKPGLRSARRGISRVISELAGVKWEEVKALSEEAEAVENVSATVESFETKIVGLKGKIQGIEDEDEKKRIEGMKKEEVALGRDIQELETRLFQMRNRQKALGREIESLTSGLQSRLSSYEAALSLAEKEIVSFVARPPPVVSNEAKEAVWALPRERRTLGMVGEWCGETKEGLMGQMESAQSEAKALEEGGEVWREVVKVVDGVEEALRKEMGRMEDPLVGIVNERPENGMKGMLEVMGKARERVEEKLDLAEKRDWRLLLCCVGAELEALIEGQAVLEGAMEMAREGRGERDLGNGRSEGRENGATYKAPSFVDDMSTPIPRPQEPPSLLQGPMERSEDEDDEPGPELLISHHEE